MLSPTRRTGPSSSAFGALGCGAQELEEMAEVPMASPAAPAPSASKNSRLFDSIAMCLLPVTRQRFFLASLISVGMPIFAAVLVSCMHPGPKLSAFFTPVHLFTGCGAFQRSSPKGGAANGIPLKEATPSFTTPSSSPPVTFAVWICASAGCDMPSATATIRERARRAFTGWPPLSSRLEQLGPDQGRGAQDRRVPFRQG